MQAKRVKQEIIFLNIFLGQASNSCVHIQSRLTAAFAA